MDRRQATGVVSADLARPIVLGPVTASQAAEPATTQAVMAARYG